MSLLVLSKKSSIVNRTVCCSPVLTNNDKGTSTLSPLGKFFSIFFVKSADNGDFCFYTWMGVVIRKRKIFKHEIIYILLFRIYCHLGKSSWFTRKLLFDLVVVVSIHVNVSISMHEISGLITAHLR